jgi:hypothetical protein
MNRSKTLRTLFACASLSLPAAVLAQAPAKDHSAEHEAHTRQQSAPQNPGAKAPATQSPMHMMDQHMRRMTELRAEIAAAPTPEKREAAIRAQMHEMQQSMKDMKGMKSMGMGGMGGMGMGGKEGAEMGGMHKMMEKRMSMMEEMMESMMQMMQMRMDHPAEGRMPGMGKK